ncbi:MAG: homoserine dehydrogenase [Deltaproteobacteria bacterium]|nr:homoserine dehydrogenase [Deltaproteobacteria bacterium]
MQKNNVQTDRPLKPLLLGLAGYGTVGSGLARILDENREAIRRRAGRDIRIKSVLVRDPSRPRQYPLPEGASFCTEMSCLYDDPELDVVVELIGGVVNAGEVIRRSLLAGKHVVTANKALLAEDGKDLFQLAAEKGLYLGYEASVCGGIPVVQTLRESLAANRIVTLSGILNGTCNYILSSMTSKGMSFDAALKEAQDQGFAEADPTLDIEGFDAAHKLALLIRLAWGIHYPFKDLPVSGISRVAAEDIQFAREFGYNIKLLGYAQMEGDTLDAGVFPFLVPNSYLLAKVGYSYNAVRIEGNAVGSVFLHGRGAGDMPTGSAVAADILAIARGDQPNNLGFCGAELPAAKIRPPKESRSRYYFRLQVQDKPGVMRDVAAILAENNISIHQALQKGLTDVVPLMFMTHLAKTRDVENALASIAACGFTRAEPVYYRVLPQPNESD